MRNQIARLFSTIALGIGVLVLLAPAAKAQERCIPFGGTIYGWLTDHWQGVGNLTVGGKVWHAKLNVDTLSVVDGGDTWTGKEALAFDFGNGNILKGAGPFVTEHMTDPGGVAGSFSHQRRGTVRQGKRNLPESLRSLGHAGSFWSRCQTAGQNSAPARCKLVLDRAI